MSAKGLGRGLGSLFGDFEEEQTKQEQKTQVAEKEIVIKEVVKEVIKEVPRETPEEIDMNLIDRNTSQPRKIFAEEQLQELAQSIKNCGLIQPIILVKRGNRFMIVSGERRWRASKIAGLKTIPAVIRDYTDEQIAEVALIENLQREDLNPIESANAIKELIEKFNLTQEQISERIGKSRSAVTNTLRLLSLAPYVIKLIQDGKLSAGHGKILVTIPDNETQVKIANMAVEGKISVRELEKYLQTLSHKTTKAEKKITQSLELIDFTNKLQQTLSTKVQIKGSEKKGKILIEYYSKDDLNRIYSLLKY